MSDAVRLNQWSQFDYCDPREVLLDLRKVESLPEIKDLPKRVRTLRTRELSRTREGRQAALFCHGIGSCVLKSKVLFALVEDEDFDFVARWQQDDEDRFCPTQLKEWVPAKLNPRQSIDSIVDGLRRKYPSSRDLSVAIYVNRSGSEAMSVDTSGLTLAGLWLFGSASRDQSEWFLWGNLMQKAQEYRYHYPTGRSP